MSGKLLPEDILMTIVPIAIVGVIYYLLLRFRRRGLSTPVRIAFKTTLTIITVWGAFLLVTVATTGGFIRAIFIIWMVFIIPVIIGSFTLTWSVVTLFKFKTQSDDDAIRVTSRGRTAAIVVIVLAVIALVGYSYREQQLSLAGNSDISPERLRDMYHSQHAGVDNKVKKNLAINTATPVDVLLQLARHPDLTVRQVICYNSAAPLSVLLVLAQDENWRIRWCVPRHPNVSAALLTQLASDPSADVRRSVAGVEATPSERLLMLSRDSSDFVRTALAMNKATPVDALIELMKDKHENMRRLVAAHPALPLTQQLQLAEDESATVRQALLSKLAVPREVLAKLENDTDEKTRRLVKDRYRYYRKSEKQGASQVITHGAGNHK